ncbi:outer membrane beta-barrel protein [Candidatus Palauibacter soopunensis]|uniref:outer membrane beta-barrel protein n=1 Tax=Candidatus Palauibacter soopunensis TaxID=3056739 RepID=UPI00238A553C|nr:outer membrane beta-barrel protein [Candidatus Palauibacter soopunensis]MDE2878991.1 outer membrane beta-barrel protein [Candidatus Palauibacter soopunensis]
MRRIVFFGLMLLATPAAAQTTLGVRGGIGVSTVTMPEGYDTETRAVAIVGIDVGIQLSDAVSLRLGGSYSPIEADGEAGRDHRGHTVSLWVDYVQLSALGRWTPTARDGWAVGILFGPWTALKRSCHVAAGFTRHPEPVGRGLSPPLLPLSERVRTACDHPNLGLSTNVKSINFGLSAGVGLEIPLADRLRFGLDALYSFGLTAIRDDGYWKTRHLGFQAGPVFLIG